jgi:Uma2 family endonuclease
MNHPQTDRPGKKTSVDDYLAGERRSSHRGEFINGELMPKPAANRWHNLIATNTAIAVGSRLGGAKTEIYVNGMLVQLGSKLVCYPDVVLVSGEPVFADANSDVLQNPTAVIDIYSGSTNISDKTRKLESYLAIPSIKECLLIRADEMRVEQYARQNAKQWIYRIYDERDAVISLDSANVKLSLSEIYAQTNFKQAELSSKAVN